MFLVERWRQLRTFLSETRAEMKKVTFPSYDEVIATTVVVVVTSIIFAFYLWLSDIVIMRVYQGIFGIFGS
jgi:preprotein translocase subunit SecE